VPTEQGDRFRKQDLHDGRGRHGGVSKLKQLRQFYAGMLPGGMRGAKETDRMRAVRCRPFEQFTACRNNAASISGASE
jgi:hypothetical protein